MLLHQNRQSKLKPLRKMQFSNSRPSCFNSIQSTNLAHFSHFRCWNGCPTPSFCSNLHSLQTIENLSLIFVWIHCKRYLLLHHKENCFFNVTCSFFFSFSSRYPETNRTIGFISSIPSIYCNKFQHNSLKLIIMTLHPFRNSLLRPF
jgi:hypothetical protein